MALPAALELLQLKKDRLGQAGEQASILFSAEEIACLEALMSSLEGKTKLQQNPHAKYTLAWAAWAIARLGRWKVAKNRPPGVISFKRGLQKFKILQEAWTLAKKMKET